MDKIYDKINYSIEFTQIQEFYQLIIYIVPARSREIHDYHINLYLK